MKKALIYTLYGNYNYGNKLQNYAVQEILGKSNIETNTVILKKIRNKEFIKFVKKIIKLFIPKYRRFKKYEKEREKNFLIFDKKISKIKYKNVDLKKYDCVIVGSDQVWNPLDLQSQQIVEEVNKIENNKIISYAASIAVDNIPEQYKEKYKKQFLKINHLSVRENEGKKIIEDLTNRDDLNVIVDPTMMLSVEEWDKVSSKPKQMEKFEFEEGKYILTYFLGNLSKKAKDEMNKFATDNNLKIINLLDKNDPFYTCGPSEFLYLEKNAFLVCTDSFHSCVFAILFNTPFITYERIDNQGKMNSRLNNLLKLFKLEDRKYNGNITLETINVDYTKAYTIIEEEKNKSKDFLIKALEDKNE